MINAFSLHWFIHAYTTLTQCTSSDHCGQLVCGQLHQLTTWIKSTCYVASLAISPSSCVTDCTLCKMVNGFRYYRALETVSISSALSTALTIYPCQIRVHQRWQSKLQLPTARKKEWWPATADSSPQAVTCQLCDTHYFSRPWTHNLPIVGPAHYQ